MDVTKLENVRVLNHPLLTHKINKLRSVNTRTNEFRQIVEEISMLEGYEALRNVKTIKKEVQTPIETTTVEFVEGKRLCFVPILRAGLGMAEGMLRLVPRASCGHIGMYRDEVTHKPVEYYCKLPQNISEKDVILVDPMLATGGSGIDAVRKLREHGAKNIMFICIIAAPEGVEAFHKEFPDVPLVIGALDRELNENAYICPGLGDCGDRIFGTVVDNY